MKREKRVATRTTVRIARSHITIPTTGTRITRADSKCLPPMPAYLGTVVVITTLTYFDYLLTFINILTYSFWGNTYKLVKYYLRSSMVGMFWAEWFLAECLLSYTLNGPNEWGKKDQNYPQLSMQNSMCWSTLQTVYNTKHITNVCMSTSLYALNQVSFEVVCNSKIHRRKLIIFRVLVFFLIQASRFYFIYKLSY